MRTDVMTEPSQVIHGSFTVERTYRHAPSKVFFAHADTATKRRWFIEGEGWEVFEHRNDFRVGGEEFSRFRFGDGPEMTNVTQYQDIVPDRRIVISYRMTVAGVNISVSLATIQIDPIPGGCRVTYTEQGAYFDEPNALAMREEGCRELLEALARELDRAA